MIMQWWKIINQRNNYAELLLYGIIGDGWISDNSSKEFAAALQGLKNTQNITVRINSPGGEVWAAQAIYSLIKNHPAHVTVVIDGLAASAASLIAMAGDKILMPSNALMMIHNPMACIAGDSGDMLHAADVLAKTKDTMINVYSEKTGKDSKTISDMMNAETWMTAEEALQDGFIDEVDKNTVVNFFAGNRDGSLVVNGLPVDLMNYKNIPAAIIAAVSIRPPTGRKMEENIMNAEQIKTEYPDIYNQIYSAGIAAERARIKDIDSIRAIGYEAIKDKAKYETFAQAGAVAIEIVNAQSARIAGVASGLAEDVLASNVNNIPMGDAPLLEPGVDEAAAKALMHKAIEAANKNLKGR